MSLINQMLRDLEQRQHSQAAQPRVSPVGVPNTDQRAQRPPAAVLWGLSAGLILAVIWAFNPGLLEMPASSEVFDTPPPQQARRVDTVPAKPFITPPEARQEIVVAHDELVANTADASATRSEVLAPHQSHDATLDPKPITVESKPRARLTASAPVIEKPKLTKQRRLDPAQQARLKMDLARQQLQRGDLASAAVLMTEAIALQPAWPEPRTQLVALHQQDGNWQKADQLLQDALRIEPDSAYWSLMRGKALWQNEGARSAIKVLEKARIHNARDDNLDLFLAALYQRTDQHTASASVYQDILARHQDHGKAWLGLGISLQALQQPGDALAAFQQALRSGGHESNVLNYIEQRIAVLLDEVD